MKKMMLLFTILATIFPFQVYASCWPARLPPTAYTGGPFTLHGSAGDTYLIKCQGGNPLFDAKSTEELNISSGATYSCETSPCSPITTKNIGFYTQHDNGETSSVKWLLGYGGTISLYTGYPVASPKNLGPIDPARSPRVCEGNPIFVSTGNKFLAETDFVGGMNTHIELRRYYNSLAISATGFGQNWRSTYDRSVLTWGDNYAQVTSPEGRIDSFWLVNGVWVSDPDVRLTLTAVMSGGVQVGWQVVQSDDTTENYNISGQLTSIVTRSGLTTTLTYNASNQLAAVTGPFGHSLSYTYTSSGNVYQVTIPSGGIYTYAYDSNNNLISVTYPDSTSRQYAYTNTSYIHALTGITDENGNAYASFAYDSNGRAVSTQHAGGAGLTTISYTTLAYKMTSATATDPMGNAHKYSFTTQFGIVKPTSMTGAPVQSVGGKAFTYDTNGFIASKTDYNNNVIIYTHDARGNETSRTEAYGTSMARTISTAWSDTFNLPTQITEPNRTTTFTYDASGNMLTKTVTAGADTRTWAFTYNTNGQLLTAQDPNSNTTILTYDNSGNVATITDALGHVFSYTSYDANGNLLSVTDPNGLVTTITYDARGRIVSINKDSGITSYTYDSAGNLTKITRPDSSFVIYTYDAAHRLIGVSDALGNSIAYTLDAANNVTARNIYDQSSVLKWTRSYTYDSVERLTTEVGATGQTTTYGYDSNSNLTNLSDPLSHATAFAYDALNRRKQITDPNNSVIQYGFDANDHITSVTDPRSLVASYTYTGLDNQTVITSPDAGTTTKTFDAAGNVLSATDARGVTATNTYDALNRLTSVTFTDGTTMTYQYDQGTYGNGHLTAMTDPSGSTVWSYDIKGSVLQKQQTIGTVTLTAAYQYCSTCTKLAGITYPSGRQVSFIYDDVSGKLASIQVDGQPIISSVSWRPFGPVAGWAQGNGSSYGRSFDQDGRISGITIGGTPPETVALTYDAAGRITGSSDNLATVQIANTGTTNFQYPSTSNRLLGSTGGMAKSYAYDASGGITGDGTNVFSYDGRGRLTQVTAGSDTTQYAINGLGQRVAKTGAGVATGAAYFVYDEAGHLLGEYDASGNVLQETVWLGDLPVAILKPGAVYYVNPDHLGAPLTVTDSNGTIVWRWDRDPFGNGIPNENPGGTGTFTYNLRFPGQYYDQETGLHYNYFRDYNPKTGRYVQADPIGFDGGDVNLYAYVGNNSIMRTDPTGLTWATNANFLYDFLTGSGISNRFYGPDTIENQEIQCSPGAAVLRDAFYAGHGNNVAYGTLQAAEDTLLDPTYWSSTALQVGGFGGASAVNNGNGTVTFTIQNVAGASSFFYHLVPDRTGSAGPLRNINQTFTWTENVCGVCNEK